MHVISQKRIWDAKLRFPGCASALDGWYRIIKKNNFKGFNDLKKAFSSLDKVNNYYIFDIGGNKLRLIAIIFFEHQKIYVQEILSHAEYDKRNFSKRN